MTISPTYQPTKNLMVPSGGTTHAVSFKGKFDVSGQLVDWRQFKLDNFPFEPQGCYIDNSAGTTPCRVIIGPVGWEIYVEPGTQRAVPFPAPANQTAKIYADPTNDVAVVFVDYPVFPDNGGLSGDINAVIPATAPAGEPYQVALQGTPAVSISGTPAVSVSGTPTVKVDSSAAVSVNITGTLTLPVSVQRGKIVLVPFDLGVASGGNVTVSAPTDGPQYKVRKISIAGSPDIAPWSTASAGNRLQINDALAGGLIGLDYLPLSGPYFRELDFGDMMLRANSLVMDLSTPLTAGELSGVVFFEAVI